MDTFMKFLMFGIFCVIFPRINGRKLHTYEPYWGSTHSIDESKFVEEKVLNMHPEKSKNDESFQNWHLFKLNSDVSKEFQQKLPQNENQPTKLNSIDFETLETQVGEHLVKVKSEKESESLSYVPRGRGGYDISINPKYSHIVEIIHRRDDPKKQNKPAITYGSAIQKQAVELKIPDSEKVIKTKLSENSNKVGETNEGNSEKFKAHEKDTEESGKTEEQSEALGEAGERDTEELGEAGERDTEELGEAGERDTEEFGESGEGDPEEFGEADEGDPEEFEENEREIEGFCESDEENPEEYDEAEDTKEFDEEDPEEYDETERDTEEFGESDKDYPKESNETEKNRPEFEIVHEGNVDECNDTENDPEQFGESNEREPEKFGEANERDSEESKEIEEDLEKSEVDEDDSEFIKANVKKTEAERDPEIFEVDEGNIVESSKTDERDENLSGGIEDTKKFEEPFFNEEFDGSGEEFVDTNDRNTSKTGRILGMLSRRNESFPTCTTQRGEAGHCRRLGECLLSEALSNFNGFLQQLCLIRGALVGICCPDNPVIETVNPDDNATKELSAEEIEQPPEGCGLNTKTRIVGGSISVPHEWTWMVALMRRNRFYCGGVIINNWYILTAAHCVMGMNVKDLTVRLGEYDFNEQSKHTEDLSVSEIKRHAQFVTLTFQHDIALLKLKRSIKYSKFVGSICLPELKARDYSDVKGTVVGWGTVSFGGAASPVLRQVTVPVWKNKDCDRTYLLESIGDSFMCAGAPEKGEDACQGDSGGPLMTVNQNGRWEVIGLVSWGRRCGDPTYPGVYTRVTTYLDWIKQNAV